MIRKWTYLHGYVGLLRRQISHIPQILKICNQFTLHKEQLQEIVSLMTREIELGLGKDTHHSAKVKCLVTHVQDLPTGNERGHYLALDLGGTNFRCLLANLKSSTEIDITSKSFLITEKLMEGPGVNLFDFIAECLAGFCKEHMVENDNLALGFTFSFPLQNDGIDKGILKTWTKGFNCEGVVGQDVVQLMRDAINRRGDIKVHIVAILNDTTGTLISSAYSYQNCRIGLILGTGINACYVESTANTEMFEGYKTSSKPNMIINTELGAFGDNGILRLILTPFDRIVDLESVNPNKQIFEKCTSGMYLGELVRLILVNLMYKGVIFKGQTSDLIFEKWRFHTRFISKIESDLPGQYQNGAMVLEQMGIQTSEERELAGLRYICETISKRSAQLSACALVCLIRKMNVTDCSVGVDGGLYRYHPYYHRRLTANMSLLLEGTVNFELFLSTDGSGRGAALIAAVNDNRPEPPQIISKDI